MYNRAARALGWVVAATWLTAACEDARNDSPGGASDGSSEHATSTNVDASTDAAQRSTGPEAASTHAATSTETDAGAAERLASAGAGGGTRTQSDLPDVDDGTPTWTNIYTFVFRTCRSQGCHGSSVAGINMATKDAAYNSLVGVPASPKRECAELGKRRIVPNDPENSLLYLKLDIDAPCGQQMPPGGQLPQAARDRVRDWIRMGAKND